MWLLNGTPEHFRAAPPPWAPRGPTTSTRSASMDKTVKLFNVNDGAVARATHHTSGRLALLPGGLLRPGSATGRHILHGLARAVAKMRHSALRDVRRAICLLGLRADRQGKCEGACKHC